MPGKLSIGFEYVSRHWAVFSALAAFLLLVLASLFTDFSLGPYLEQSAGRLESDQKRSELDQRKAARLLAEAESHLREGLYSEASRAFAEAAKLDPASAAARFGLRKATLFEAGADGEYAPEVIQRRLEGLLAEAPDDPHLLTLKGNLLKRSGDLKGAQAAYHRAVTADPTFAEAHYGLGVIALMEQRFPAARALFEKALNHSRSKARYLAAHAQSLAMVGDYATAAKQYHEALKRDADDLLLHAEQALVLLHLDRIDEATAVARELEALLDDERVAGLRKNAGAWGFPTPDRKTHYLRTDREKHRFAQALHSSLALLGGREAAASRLAELTTSTPIRSAPLWIVVTELVLYADEYPNHQPSVQRILSLLAPAG